MSDGDWPTVTRLMICLHTHTIPRLRLSGGARARAGAGKLDGGSGITPKFRAVLFLPRSYSPRGWVFRVLASERGGAQLRRVGLAAGSGSEHYKFPTPTPWQLQPQSEASLGCVDCPKVGYLFLSSPLSPKEIKDRPQPSNSRFLGFFFLHHLTQDPFPPCPPLMDHPCAAHGYVCTPPHTPSPSVGLEEMLLWTGPCLPSPCPL